MANHRKEQITLAQLNHKLDQEAKRLVKEKEDGINKYISRQANLEGNSTMTFKKSDRTEITLSFRLNDSNDLRFAYEERFTDK